MKKIVNRLVMWLFVSFTASCEAVASDSSIVNDPALEKIAMDTKSAIVNMDNKYIMKYVSPKGTSFIDDGYSREQVNGLLNDRNGWLYKRLYTGDSSVKKFFETSQDVHIKIYERGVDAVMILYESSQGTEKKSLENCFIKIDGNWYFDGIFSCE